MSDATFEKVSRSDKPLYGPPRLLMCGFPPEAQSKFGIVLDRVGLTGVPLVWVTAGQAAKRIADLLDLPDGSGYGLPSGLPRAVVVSGIMEGQLHQLMNACRKTGMKQALWAVLTPVSETWTLDTLLAELAAERDALARRKQ